MTGKIGDYSVGRTLGQGATGKVKFGIHVVTGKHVAIKMMNPEIDKTAMGIVLNEIQALK